jgi:hypothetical protein
LAVEVVGVMSLELNCREQLNDSKRMITCQEKAKNNATVTGDNYRNFDRMYPPHFERH